MQTFRLIHESGIARAVALEREVEQRAAAAEYAAASRQGARHDDARSPTGPKPLLCLNRLWAARRSWTAHHLQASARAMATSSRLRLRILDPRVRVNAHTQLRSQWLALPAWATSVGDVQRILRARATRRCPTASACGSRCATMRSRPRGRSPRTSSAARSGSRSSARRTRTRCRCSAAAPRPPRSAATGRSATTPAARPRRRRRRRRRRPRASARARRRARDGRGERCGGGRGLGRAARPAAAARERRARA